MTLPMPPIHTKMPPAPSKLFKASLWVVQILLFAIFGMAGFMKSTMPLPELAQRLAWTGVVPQELVRFIGIVELAGALGLVLPSITRIKPILTPIAAACLALVMILATVFHTSRAEFAAIPITVSFGGLAAFVAWGRNYRAPIQPR